MNDPYDILELPKGASTELIRSAYRRMAKKYHPDGGAATASKEKFAEIQNAYRFLSGNSESAATTSYQRRWREYAKHQKKNASDPKPRSQKASPPPNPAASPPNPASSKPESDAKTTAEANAEPRGFDAKREHDNASRRAEGHGSTANAEPKNFNPEREENLRDILDQLKRHKSYQSKQEHARAKVSSKVTKRATSAAEITHWLTVSFADAIFGVKKEVEIDTDRRISVNIPAGIGDGQKLRIPPKVDFNEEAYIGVVVLDHQLFRRQGRDIQYELPVRLDEALLGTDIIVPTLNGRTQLAIPAGTYGGKVLCLQGQGLPAAKGQKAGDLLITIQIMWPEVIDDELANFLRDWGQSKVDYNPRKEIEANLLQ